MHLFFLEHMLLVGKNSLHLCLGFLVRNTPSNLRAECGGSSFWARKKTIYFSVFWRLLNRGIFVAL